MSVSLDVLHQVGMPGADSVDIVRRRFRGGDGPRVALVAGIRGDAPEGIRVAHEVASFLEQVSDQLVGTVDVYPCVNPLAAHRGSRRWPFFDLDLNRRFPGSESGHAPDVVAWKLISDLAGADQVIELRGAHPDFREAAQAHVREGNALAVERAKQANVQVIWERNPTRAAPSTFAAQFDSPIVLEGGSGNRLSAEVGRSLWEGVLNLLNVLGVLPDEALPFHWASIVRPLVVDDDRVQRVRAQRAGFFLPTVGVWEELEQGQVCGTVVDPSTGAVLESVTSPLAGRVLAVRERPVVFPGSMLVRVVGGSA
jgi:uncharacterized protein